MKSEKTRRPNSAINKLSRAVSKSDESNRPKSAVSMKTASKPPMKLKYMKREMPPPDVNPSHREVVAKRASKQEQKIRDFGSLHFYLDPDHFQDNGKPRPTRDNRLHQSESRSPKSNTFDRVCRPTIRHIPSPNIRSDAILRGEKRFDHNHTSSSHSTLHAEPIPSLSINDTHIYDPAFLTGLRNVSYLYPSHTHETVDSSEVEEVKEVKSETPDPPNHHWRTIKSSTIYPYHRRYELLRLNELPTSKS